MKVAILVLAALLVSTPLLAETITVPGTRDAVAVKIVKMCMSQGEMIQLKFNGPVYLMKCGDATEFALVAKGDSVTVTGHGPMAQEMFEGLK